MSKLTKKEKSVQGKVDSTKLYPLGDALKLVKECATAKFDETIEVALNLGVDPRHADQMVRGMVSLPAGTGKDVKVAVFARGDNAQKALDAGADKVGAEDLMEDMQAGNLDLGTSGRDVQFGFGLVQAKTASDRITTLGCGN